MPAEVRRAVDADAESIVRFQIAMAMETENKTLDGGTVLNGVRAVLEDPEKGFYLVSLVDGRVIGSLLMTFEWSDWRNTNIWYFQSVFVEPDCRGRGIFRLMYREILAEAKIQGVKHVRLYVETGNERAQKIYQSLGMLRLPYFMYDAEV